MRWLLPLCLWVLVAPGAYSAPVDIPGLTSEVVDEIGLLSASETSSLRDLIRRLNAKKQMQLAVLIARDLRGLDIESFSIKVTDVWKLGDKKTDKGCLLLIAPSEKRMRLEVGQGLEGELTDLFSKRLLRETVGPYFRQGNYVGGISLAIDGIEKQIDGNYPVESLQSRRNGGALPPLLRFILIAAFFLFFLFFRFFGGGHGFYSGGGHGGWGSGGGGGFSGGGGGFSGGGGGFSGGGASSDW